MKRLALTTGLLFLVALSSAMYISETQATVQEGLKELGFQVVERKDALIGAPTEFEITKQTIKQLKSLMKEGKHIRLAADGRITVVEDDQRATEKKADAKE